MGSSPFEEIVGVISLVFVDELFVVAWLKFVVTVAAVLVDKRRDVVVIILSETADRTSTIKSTKKRYLLLARLHMV